MAKITYVQADGTRHAVDVPNGENVMHGALYNGVEGIVGECGGGLACATCHCYVDEAWADVVGSPTSQDERDMLESVVGEIKPTSRLSCQILMTDTLDGLVVQVPAIQPGHVYNHTLSFWDNILWPAGAYQFDFVVDAGAANNESNEANNTGSHVWNAP